MKLKDILNEYEKGDLQAISSKSNKNISSTDTSASAATMSDDPIDPMSDESEPMESTDAKKMEPIGTNTKAIDAAARTIGSRTKSILGSPKKISDFVKHMRAQIPDLDTLIQKNPRFIQGVRKVSPDAARALSKISKDTLRTV